MSGNGLRCLAKHLFEMGIHSDKEMLVDTPSGVKRLDIHTSMGKVSTVEVHMGSPDFRRSSIPMQGEGDEAIDVPITAAGQTVSATCLSVGNPHCVLFLEDIADAMVRELGPAIENHPVFPLRVNVEFAQVIDMSEMRLRSWERGAGETMASATGASAAVAAALRTRRCKRKMHVQQPGGLMEVEITTEGDIVTRGPARRVFRGSWTRTGANAAASSCLVPFRFTRLQSSGPSSLRLRVRSAVLSHAAVGCLLGRSSEPRRGFYQTTPGGMHFSH